MSTDIDPGIFLLWSAMHGRWLTDHGRGHGYVRGFEQAGRYSRADALLLANNALPPRPDALDGAPPLLPVRLVDMVAIAALHRGDGAPPT